MRLVTRWGGRTTTPWILWTLVAALALGACTPSALAPDPTVPPPTLVPTLAPGELVRAQGEGGVASDLFRIERETVVRVEWSQQSASFFALWLTYEGEAELEDEGLYRMLVEAAEGSSSGGRSFTLPAGEWGMEVEDADGPWTMVARLDSGAAP